MRRALLIALLPLLLLAGCGGNDREGAVEVAETWLRAVGDRDAEQACELMHESAVESIRRRSGLSPSANCVGVVRAYSGSFRRGDIDGILRIGLEPNGTVRDGELGVFPRSGPRELQVILMRRDGDDWKVGGTSLGPTEPTPTPTPAG